MEKTPEEYVARVTEVFAEVRRVLRPDGTLWVNLGDCYANDGKRGGATGGKHASGLHGQSAGLGRAKRCTGLKPKDLVGIPWMVAFALRAAEKTSEALGIPIATEGFGELIDACIASLDGTMPEALAAAQALDVDVIYVCLVALAAMGMEDE